MAIQVTSGVPSAAANGKHGHTLISDEKFRQLYALTVKMRHHAQVSGTALNLPCGHEAALAGVAADLRREDVVVCAPGVHSADGLVRELNVVTPLDAGFEDRVMAAMAGAVTARMKKSGGTSVIFAAQGGPEGAEVLREARAIAWDARLPVLFVECANDQPDDGAAGKSSGRHAAMPLIPVDAEDVVAIYRVAHESIARAREGSGPTCIRCVRWNVPERDLHSGDAVEHLERWLAGRGLPAQAWRREIAAEIEKSAPAGAAAQLNRARAGAGGRVQTTGPQPQSLA